MVRRASKNTLSWKPETEYILSTENIMFLQLYVSKKCLMCFSLRVIHKHMDVIHKLSHA